MRVLAAASAAFADAFTSNDGAPRLRVRASPGGIAAVTQGCDWREAPLAEALEEPHLVHYASIEAWSSYEGEHLVGSGAHASWFGRHANLPKRRGAEPTAATCEAIEPDGTIWAATRVGPLRSFGGYDWWQFSWGDVFGFGDVVEEHGAARIFETFSGAVDGATGAPLGFPPIHIHHVHVTPGHKSFYRMNLARCALDPRECTFPYVVVFEQHGDYECAADAGGPDCLLEAPLDGYARRVDVPLAINGELNDVRAPGSGALEWYYEVAARWAPEGAAAAAATRAASVVYVASPGRFNWNDQSTMVNTFLAPTGEDSFLWYTARLPASGTLLRAKMHAHNTVFDESLFYLGTPRDVGLEDLRPKGRAFDVVRAAETRFETNDRVKARVVAAAAASGARLVCRSRTAHERVGGYDYDRRPAVFCDDWELRRGDQFTVVGFNRRQVAPPGPHVDFIPAYLPGHLHWILLTDDGTDGSAYWTIACFQDAAISQPASSTPLTRANTLQMQAGLWAMHLNGGAFTVAEFARTVALGLAAVAAAFSGPVALAVSCAKRKRS